MLAAFEILPQCDLCQSLFPVVVVDIRWSPVPDRNEPDSHLPGVVLVFATQNLSFRVRVYVEYPHSRKRDT